MAISFGVARMIAREQRAALITSLLKKYPDAKVECSDLPWLRVPKIATMDAPLRTIFAALRRHRGHTAFATEGRRLVCDIVIPSQCVIVEYDERQHFSMPRAIALGLYPRDASIGFDVAEWIAHCKTIAATDNVPSYRDEQRAFYDSVRDILAGANRYRVIRLKHGAIDWLAKNRNRDILRLLSVRPNRSNIRRHVGEHGSSVAAAVRREPKAAANQASPRFATVCVEGRPAGKYRTDPSTSRLKLLNTILQEINEQWSKLDAIVLPGGYLRLNQNIGHLPFADRVRALDAAGFVEPIKNAIKLLSRSPNTCLVFGVDGPKNGDGGDQLCVAANRTGIVGIGRKIFPTKEEADGLQCYDADFDDPHRIIELACGRKAVLCACYDMFGVADRGNVNRTRACYIKRIGTDEDPVNRGTEDFPKRLSTDLKSFERLLRVRDVTVGLVAIHTFRRSSTVYWQKHGIATCSAALRGGIAIGAAHFSKLPLHPTASTLAAIRVPKTHLSDGVYRQAHRREPNDQFEHSSALVRLFY
jgi:hypothetical protein